MAKAKKTGRDPSTLTPEMVERATEELVALVRARLPERFYKESHWRVVGAGMIARMTGIMESMALLVRTNRPSDIGILLRALYEHVVVFCWVAIDPDKRMEAWGDHSWAQRLRLHNDATLFGIEDIVKPADLDRATKARTMPRLPQLTSEVDEYWSKRTRGFRGQPERGPKDILTMRGLYTGVYRLVSRTAHGEMETVDPCLDLDTYPRVAKFEDDDALWMAAMAIPLFALALIVCHERFGWPDPDVVEAINDALMLAD
jgi:hypothetical protein